MKKLVLVGALFLSGVEIQASHKGDPLLNAAVGLPVVFTVGFLSAAAASVVDELFTTSDPNSKVDASFQAVAAVSTITAIVSSLSSKTKSQTELSASLAATTLLTHWLYRKFSPVVVDSRSAQIVENDPLAQNNNQ